MWVLGATLSVIASSPVVQDLKFALNRYLSSFEYKGFVASFF